MTKAWLTLSVLLILTSSVFCFGQAIDTVFEDGRQGTFKIELIPCACDTLKHDSVSIATNNCHDTTYFIVYSKSILDVVDSIAKIYNVPYELVYEIGMNESRWPNIYDLNHLIYKGDLQVIDRSFDILYKQLNLTGGKTRTNYLICGIYYLRKNYDIYGSWRKARYAYGRGHWKSPSQWTSLERKFMNKIDWSKYDKPN